MARKIKCPGFLCGSADVEYLGGNQRTSINLNLLHPFTLVNTKPRTTDSMISEEMLTEIFLI